MGRVFVETLPVRKFHGVGPATARKMSGLGIETGLDLKGQTLEFLQQHFGKAGSYYYAFAQRRPPLPLIALPGIERRFPFRTRQEVAWLGRF